MTVRLYVVTDEQTAHDYLVCAKNRNGAMKYVAQNVLMKLSAKPALPIDALISQKNGEAVLGKAEDLVAIGFLYLP